MAKKKILFVLAAVCLFAASSWAQSCTYDTQDLTINFKRVIPGLLDGNFSVSATKKVAFSQGNLQYRAAAAGTKEDPKWRFAEHQYDYVGDATNGNVSYDSDKSNNASISSSYTGWIDLFGWATSGNSAAGTHYQPWDNSSENTYGNTSKSDGTNPGSGENWDASKADWGQNMTGTWRTLTKDEWVYLLSTRTNASTLRKWATVNSVPGLIIMPDGWSGTIANSYDLDAWTTLEGQGAVFLPAAGRRGGTSVYNAGSYGDYWSSSASGASVAYSLRFYSSYVNPQDDNYRSCGYSVRLVQDVE